MVPLHTVPDARATSADDEGPWDVEVALASAAYKNPRNNATYATVDPVFVWDPAVDRPSDGSASGIAGYHIEIDDEILPGLVVATQFGPVGLAEGAHTVRVRALDHAGNHGLWSPPLQFRLDTIAPEIASFKPDQDVVYHNGQPTTIPTGGARVAFGSFAVSASVTDGGSLVDYVTIEREGTEPLVCDASGAAFAVCELAESGPATRAQRNVTVVGVDRANHSVSASASYSWSVAGVAERPCGIAAYCNVVLARAPGTFEVGVVQQRAGGTWAHRGSLDPLTATYEDPIPTALHETREYRVVYWDFLSATYAPSNSAIMTSQHDGQRIGTTA